MAHPAFAFRTPFVETVETVLALDPKAVLRCPLCRLSASSVVLQRIGEFSLHECAGCALQFWEPRAKFSAFGSAAADARATSLQPLDAGQRFFLSDLLAPRCGRLLDVGCGTGGFLIACSLAGYTPSGIEPHPKAALLASRHCPRARVFPVSIESFSSHFPCERFDIISFFHVLQHQSDPSSFLAEVRSRLRPLGFIAFSVPDRQRWQIPLDHSEAPSASPLLWNPQSLRAALKLHGFSVMSLRHDKPDFAYTAARIRSLLPPCSSKLDGNPQEPNPDSRHLRGLERIKRAASLPLAAVALPFLRWRAYAGPGLYCLARRLD